MDLFLLENKIPKAAFDLFRFWTSKLGDDQKQIIINNEQVLISDLRQAFKEALKVLLAKENRHKKAEGWQIGFVLGFVGANLSRGWYQDYIVRNSRGYKIFTGIQAIESYLKFDKVAKSRIDRIYEHLLMEDINLENVDPHIQKNDIEIDKKTAKIEFKTGGDHGKIDAILNDLKVKQIKKVVKIKNKNLPKLPIQDHFTTWEIDELIRINELNTPPSSIVS